MSTTAKAYEEKIGAQLQQTKAQLDELEARAKGKMAQAEIETISHLKATQQEIEKKRQELKTSGDAKIEQVKSEIDAQIAKLKSSLEQVSTRVKSEVRKKAGG
jgi:hypothetical protein